MTCLNPCRLPFHDFRTSDAPRGGKAVCSACNSRLDASAARWYLAGATDALASISRAERVREAEAAMAVERADKHRRAVLKGRALAGAGADAGGDDDGDAWDGDDGA